MANPQNPHLPTASLLQRSLLRLREATVAELAGHSGVEQATVENFLNDHPEWVTPVGPVSAGRNHPDTMWKLLPKGEEIFLEEIKRLSKVKVTSPDLEDERDKSLIAIGDSIRAVLEAVQELKPKARAMRPDEFEVIYHRLEQRVAVTQIAIDDLRNAERSVIDEQKELKQAKRQLTQLMNKL